jgi:hypothetical protein
MINFILILSHPVESLHPMNLNFKSTCVKEADRISIKFLEAFKKQFNIKYKDIDMFIFFIAELLVVKINIFIIYLFLNNSIIKFNIHYNWNYIYIIIFSIYIMSLWLYIDISCPLQLKNFFWKILFISLIFLFAVLCALLFLYKTSFINEDKLIENYKLKQLENFDNDMNKK